MTRQNGVDPATDSFKFKRHQDCPDRLKRHTKAPEGYLQWHGWADKKSKTHVCGRCPTCGYWTVWTPKAARSIRRPEMGMTKVIRTAENQVRLVHQLGQDGKPYGEDITIDVPAGSGGRLNYYKDGAIGVANVTFSESGPEVTFPGIEFPE